ncbi:MAG TPA: response regulator transcription factor [Candidatus Limnocylindria bacterium]|nr:response regulator transcription factor [Candidatus Limnocylindria bacterium]
MNRPSLKFLIVDDHASMRRTLRELLTLPADDVREAVDGGQAEVVFEEQRPDWVIMDVQMHPVGGLAATRHIMARHPEARVIMISQFDDVDLRSSAREAGARAYVIKDDLLSLRGFVHSPTV